MAADLEFTIAFTNVVGVMNDPDRQPQYFLLQRLKYAEVIGRSGGQYRFRVGIQ